LRHAGARARLGNQQFLGGIRRIGKEQGIPVPAE
jgi:hypothetical protein